VPFALMLFAILPLISFARATEPPQIFSWPAVSARYIAFGYAGDLWVVDRGDRTTRRLKAGAGLESHPVFSRLLTERSITPLHLAGVGESVDGYDSVVEISSDGGWAWRPTEGEPVEVRGDNRQ
jgi:hypothetical protein